MGIGAVLSGVGSVAAGVASLTAYHRKEIRRCQERIKKLLTQRDRWSHLP